MKTHHTESHESATSVHSRSGSGGGGAFFGRVIQAKLTINRPGDRYEVEADRSADNVVRMRQGDNPVFLPGSGPSHVLQRECTACGQDEIQRFTCDNISLQRECSECGDDEIQRFAEAEPSLPEASIQRECAACESKKEEEGAVQRKIENEENHCPACAEDKKIQAKSENLPAEGNAAVPALVLSVLKSGSGFPLAPQVKAFMEMRLGVDLTPVRILTDRQAAKSAEAVHARAYTHGNKIVFGDGQYNPGTEAGVRLLAHELTHVVQQGGASIKRKEDSADAPGADTGVSAEAGCSQGPTPGQPQSKQSQTDETAPPDNNVKPTVPASQTKGILAEQAPPTLAQPNPSEREPLKLGSINDPAFEEFGGELGKKAKKQRKHEAPAQKSADAQQSADPGDKSVEMQKGAQVLTTQEIVTTEPDQPFSAEKFKSELRKKIADQFPNDKGGYNSFKKDPGAITDLKGQPLADINEAKTNTVSNVQEINSPEKAGEDHKKSLITHEVQPLQPEVAGPKQRLPDAGRAVPKPQTPDAFQLPEENNAESLDKAMADNNLTEQQLADSDEPGFIKGLMIKKDTQAKLCTMPGKMKTSETGMIQSATTNAQGQANSTMTGMAETRQTALSAAESEQLGLQSDDVVRLNEYFAGIQKIFDDTTTAVNNKLECLDCQVSEIFQSAVDTSFERFKDNVEERLDDYYGADLLLVTVSNEQEEADASTRFINEQVLKPKIKTLEGKLLKLGPGDPSRPRLEKELQTLRSNLGELIIDRIFKEEKDLFLSGLDTALDQIATLVETQLNAAKKLVKVGNDTIETERQKLPTDLQTKAEEKTSLILDGMKGLEETISEKEKDLIDGLAKQYADNVNKLAEEFEKIRAEEAMPLWKRAWNKIKEIAMIIVNLAETLYKVAVKAANVIGDILAHPIRFIGNLIDAVGMGFRNFKKNIITHLQNIAFKLIMKVVPPGLKFPTEWDGKGMFSFVLQLFGLSKENVRMQAVEKLGETVVAKMEDSFELFRIIREEGLGGLWSKLMDKIGNIKDQILDAAVSFFKQQIIEKAVEFLLSVLTPVSGFIKACKSIIGIVGFFLKNLANILKLFDSILDSFADIVAGRLGSAALRIENAFADLLLLGIKFLAALIGINLDAIQEKIGKIIDKVKNPVNRAIKWIIDQAVAFARRTGLTKAVQKVKAGIKKGKEWAVEKAENVKQKFKRNEAKVPVKMTPVAEDIESAESPFLTNQKIKKEEAVEVAAVVSQRQKHLIKPITVTERAGRWDYDYIQRSTIEGSPQEEITIGDVKILVSIEGESFEIEFEGEQASGKRGASEGVIMRMLASVQMDLSTAKKFYKELKNKGIINDEKFRQLYIAFARPETNGRKPPAEFLTEQLKMNISTPSAMISPSSADLRHQLVNIGVDEYGNQRKSLSSIAQVFYSAEYGDWASRKLGQKANEGDPLVIEYYYTKNTTPKVVSLGVVEVGDDGSIISIIEVNKENLPGGKTELIEIMMKKGWKVNIPD